MSLGYWAGDASSAGEPERYPRRSPLWCAASLAAHRHTAIWWTVLVAVAGHPRSTLMTRLAAAMHGDASAETVEAYRRAGQAPLLTRICSMPNSCVPIWWPPAAARGRRARTRSASWYAPGMLSPCRLSATSWWKPPTGPTRPRQVTCQQSPPSRRRRSSARSGTGQHCARRAASDETYDVRVEIALPVQLPAWVKVEPCPPVHLAAMLAAARAIRGRAEAALDDMVTAPPAEGTAETLSRLRPRPGRRDRQRGLLRRVRHRRQPGCSAARSTSRSRTHCGPASAPTTGWASCWPCRRCSTGQNTHPSRSRACGCRCRASQDSTPGA